MESLIKYLKTNKMDHIFDLDSVTGKPHALVFSYRLSVYDRNGNVFDLSFGSDKTKKKAKQVAALEFLKKHNIPAESIDKRKILLERKQIFGNAVGRLQEYSQKCSLDNPIYEFSAAIENSLFNCSCILSNMSAIGIGISKQSSKHHAASLILQSLTDVKSKQDNSASITNMPTLDSLNFFEHGAAILKTAISASESHKLSNIITKYIGLFATEATCTINEYLVHVNYWERPSIMTESLTQWIVSSLQTIIEKLFLEQVLHLNTIVIDASNFLFPSHKDISHSTLPHEFSIWIALFAENVSNCELKQNDFMEVIPNRPEDTVEIKKSETEWENGIPYIPKMGQALILNYNTMCRFFGAQNPTKPHFYIITYWKRASFKCGGSLQAKQQLNNIEDYDYQPIFQLLQRGLNLFIGKKNSDGFVECIETWQQLLNENINKQFIDFKIDTVFVSRILSILSILYKTRQQHNGRDCLNRNQSELWKHFLTPLNNYLKTKGYPNLYTN